MEGLLVKCARTGSPTRTASPEMPLSLDRNNVFAPSNSTRTSVNGVSNDVSDTAGHSWLQVGLKATYKF